MLLADLQATGGRPRFDMYQGRRDEPWDMTAWWNERRTWFDVTEEADGTCQHCGFHECECIQERKDAHFPLIGSATAELEWDPWLTQVAELTPDHP